MTIVVGYYKEACMYYVRIIKANGIIVRALLNTEKEANNYVVRYLRGL